MQIKIMLLFIVISIFNIDRGEETKLTETCKEKPVALMNGVAHLGNGETIENAVITFAQGKITLVADARLVRLDLTGYEIIDIFGKHVYPIKNCSKKDKNPCLKVISKAKTKQLTEHQPANLLVLAHEMPERGNAILCIFEKGQPQPTEQYILSNNRLILR